MASSIRTTFYRQMATMMNAGVPVSEGLAALLQQTPPRRFHACLQTLRASVLAGNALSRAMAEFPNDFPPFHLAMIVAGERSGNLVLALQRLADCLEEEQAMRAQIKRELFYSQLIMGLTLLLWPGVLFGLQDNPVMFVLAGILPLLSFGVLLLLGVMIPRLSGQPLPWADHVISRLPVLGKTASLIGQTHFARNLSFLYGAGISLPEAVRWAGDASGNACLAAPMQISAERLDNGEELAAALSRGGALDPILVTMLKTGELTGNLEPMLDKAAEHFQMMTGVSLHQLKVSLGIAALLNAGLCVGIVLVRFYA